ncbi:MAG: phosphocholine cytidylyltransferase family protein [Chlorobi bacterium]|nr:phosphocholine cytidylyltransferase family protein [Chlorobiota bacterium]
MSNNQNYENVTTALLLAAGTGNRLFPLTQSSPKCLTLVNEKSILERLVIGLKKQGFKRLVIVTGYLGNCIKEFLGTKSGNMAIEYLYSPLYKTTNNIYSLWMARKIISEPFMLIESDLVFDSSQLDDMIFPDRIAVARMQPWMNGTTVTIDQSQKVRSYQNGTTSHLNEVGYKTVNIYSFSLPTWHSIVERLNQHIAAGIVNSYYETVFGDMVADGSLSLQAVSFDHKPWYEIDTIEDLAEAEKLFPAEIYKTDIPDNIILRPSHISDRFIKKIKSVESHKFAG